MMSRLLRARLKSFAASGATRRQHASHASPGRRIHALFDASAWLAAFRRQGVGSRYRHDYRGDI